MKKKHSYCYRIAVLVLLIGSLLEVFLLFLIYCFPDGIPKVESYRFVVMDSEIMEPDIHKGSLLIVKEERHNKEYEKDDIIAFQMNKQEVEVASILNRLEQADKIYYQTKKNGNTLIDPTNVQADAVLGRLQIQIPYVGWIGEFLISQAGIICVCVILIMSGYIVFHRQEDEIEVKNMNKEDKNKEIKVEEQGDVHVSIIANEKIERKIISNTEQQEKIVQANLQDVHNKENPVTEKRRIQQKPVIEKRSVPLIQKENVDKQAKLTEQRVQKQREPLRTEMFQPRPKAQTRVQPSRPQSVVQPRPARVERPSIKQEEPRILVREQRATATRPKMDVREQLELQRQKVREEMEQLERARALREANKK